jgi:hypothetical protein
VCFRQSRVSAVKPDLLPGALASVPIYACSLSSLRSSSRPSPCETVTRVKLEALALDEAGQLNNHPVTVGKPGFTWGEGRTIVTVVGVRGPDSTERTVVFEGRVDEEHEG